MSSGVIHLGVAGARVDYAGNRQQSRSVAARTPTAAKS